MPPVICWNIKQSKDLISKSLSEEIHNGLQQFIEKAESGQDLKPHISTRINNPDYNDTMFSDWGFFHFHLGTTLDPDPRRYGFIQRTNELLFAILAPNSETMYLIDVHPHTGGFINQDLLRIIEENWEELLDPHTVRGIDEIDYNPSDNDIGIFRKAGLVTISQTPGGRILFPMGGGNTTAGTYNKKRTDGTSVKDREDADKIISRVRELENWFIQQRNTLASEFKNTYSKEWDDLHFKIISFEKPAEIKELITGHILFVSS
ncbi:hypothetical protein FJR11_02755 [Anabaena sp. UHCC 0187]|nr:hypothetical protein [Anabaena sp. UHCC 0187]